MSRNSRPVLVLGSALAISAAACTNISYNQEQERLARSEGLRAVRVVDRTPTFLLPNLSVARPADPFVSGNDLNLSVTVRNEGPVPSRDFNIKVDVWVGTTPPASAAFSKTIRTSGGLAAGAETSASIGPVVLPSIAQRPVDVLVRVIADPATPTSPGGEIWESDEMNNVRERIFTIY